MDEETKMKAKLFGGGCCCCSSLITIIVLFAISFPTLDQGEFAFKFSHWSQGPVGEVMTDPGVKHVGPLNGLIRYPSVQQVLYFDNFAGWNPDSTSEHIRPPVHSRTRDGLQVYVKVSFQWQLEAAYLADLYEVLGGAEDLLDGERVEEKPSFIQFIVRVSRGALTEVCSQYTASEFFANQSAVEQTMLIQLSAAFNRPDKKLQISVMGLQLRSVDLPNEYEDSIARTQAEEQALQTAIAERDTEQTRMATVLMQETELQKELKLNAEAIAEGIRQETLAWVSQYNLFQKEQADAYAVILSQLASTNNKFQTLLELMSQKALKEHTESKTSLTM